MGLWTARYGNKRKRLFALSLPLTRWTNYVAIWLWPFWRLEVIRSNEYRHDRWTWMDGKWEVKRLTD